MTLTACGGRRYRVDVVADASAPNLDPGLRLILEEIRDLRIEMREDRHRADEDRRRADEDRRRADEDRRRADAAAAADRQRSDERFEQAMAATRAAWADVRTVGQAIVRTLNRHTRLLESQSRLLESHSRLLESIDRKFGARGNGDQGEDGGGGARV